MIVRAPRRCITVMMLTVIVLVRRGRYLLFR